MKPLRVLLVEDNVDDALLLERELRRGGYQARFDRVEEEERFRKALTQGDYDVVIADYSLPRFSGLAALSCLKDEGVDLPFIIVSGTIGEHVAVQGMKAGAHDYILKDNLSRLVPAVERELREAADRRQRRVAEMALRESEQRQKLHVQQTPLAVIEWNLKFEVMAWNPAAEEIFGYTGAEAIGRHASFIIPEGFRSQIDAIWAELTTAVSGQRSSNRNLTRDGRLIDCEWYNTPLVDDAGEVIGVASLVMDVTERRRSEEVVRALLNGTTGVGEAFFRPFVRELARALQVRHAFVAEVLAEDPERLRMVASWADDQPGATVEWDREGTPSGAVLEQGTIFFQEGLLEAFPRDADLRALQVVGYAGARLLSSSGNPLGVIGVMDPQPIRDSELARSILSIFAARAGAELERLRAEAALRKSEQDYRELVQAVPGVVYRFRVDADGRPSFPFISERVVEIFGETAAAISADPSRLFDRLSPGERRELEASTRRSMETLEPWVREFAIATRDGEEKWIRGQSIPSRFPDGSVIWHGVFLDITERKRAEQEKEQLGEQLRQAQKMEAIGTLAGGIAHDFNNILAAIIPYAHLARADAGENAAVHESLDEVLRAAERAKNLVKQILMFSRQQKQERRPMQLQPIIREALKLIRSALPSTIEIQADVDSEAPAVLSEATQFHQVLMNLCTNAAHAMRAQGGRLQISLDQVQVDPILARASPDLHPGSYVRLAVADTGTGMDDETMKRIFDPFFTTKAPNEGTGLGLSVVHGIVKEHEGAVRVRSALGVGTTFEILLPAQGTLPAETEVRQLSPTAGHGEHILFVDDEQVLCDVVDRLLRRLGYRVTVQNNPVAALGLFQANPRAYDLVFTDLTMPGLTGLALAGELLKVRPDVPIILATGYGGNLTREDARERGIRETVLKPLDLNSFAHIVHRVLHTPAEAGAAEG